MTATKPAKYRKAAIPAAVRRDLASRYGCPPGETVTVGCHYCGGLAHITWWRLSSGLPGSWVHFGHEIDHLDPESLGGPTTVDNLVLACQPCNRQKATKPHASFKGATR